MYVGIMRAGDLFNIAKVDRIRLESMKIPKYAGYQRALIEGRVDSIRDYLNTPGSTFPNAIIVSIDSDAIETWIDVDKSHHISILEVKIDNGAVTIIDGQHRCAALDNAPENFEVIVTFFIDLEMFKCAQVFAKINSTQKAVNPSIAFQLFGYAKDRSPQKTAHNIAEILNNKEGSPFFKKLLMLGSKDTWSEGTLSQSTFCKYLMSLYTRNPNHDENQLLRNEKLEMYNNYPLREFFIQKQDDKIMEIVWKFFYNVANTWKDQWHDESGKSILIKTTGYISFIEVLKKWLLSSQKDQIINNKDVDSILSNIKNKYEKSSTKFIRKNYPAGHQGVVKLRDSLLKNLNL
jgi:DGQHR domain-containing protein